MVLPKPKTQVASVTSSNQHNYHWKSYSYMRVRNWTVENWPKSLLQARKWETPHSGTQIFKKWCCTMHTASNWKQNLFNDSNLDEESWFRVFFREYKNEWKNTQIKFLSCNFIAECLCFSWISYICKRKQEIYLY